MSPLAEVTTMS